MTSSTLSFSALPCKTGKDLYLCKIMKVGSGMDLFLSDVCAEDMSLTADRNVVVTIRRIRDGLSIESFPSGLIANADKNWPFRLHAPVGSALTSGDKVYARLSPLDIEAWFDGRDAVPLGTAKPRKKYTKRKAGSAPDMTSETASPEEVSA